MRGYFYLFTILFCLFGGSVRAAGPGVATDYSKSISSHLGMRMGHFEDLAAITSFSRPSVLQNLGIINSNASASYNSMTNVITFSDEALIEDGGHLRLRTLSEIRKSGHSYKGFAGVIFHEFSHSEFEHFLKPGKTPVDALAYEALNTIAASVIVKLKPNMGYFKRRVLLSEIFAYYREEVLTTLLTDAEDVMFQAGVFYESNKCAAKNFQNAVTQRHGGIADKYFNEYRNETLPYKESIQLRFAFVNGEDIDFQPAKEEMKMVYNVLWDQLDFYFKPPKNRRELIEFMNNSPYYKKMLTVCRGQ